MNGVTVGLQDGVLWLRADDVVRFLDEKPRDPAMDMRVLVETAQEDLTRAE